MEFALIFLSFVIVGLTGILIAELYSLMVLSPAYQPKCDAFAEKYLTNSTCKGADIIIYGKTCICCTHEVIDGYETKTSDCKIYYEREVR